MRIVSLFSGIGFQEMALPHGHEILAFCEVNSKLSKCFSAIHGVPESKNLGDIRTIQPSRLSDLREAGVDILISTFPCQSFSIAGKKLGTEDETNGDLYLYILDFIRNVQPKVIIFENVKNITSPRFNVVPVLKKELSDMGYSSSDKVLDSRNFGVPQHRERWFMVCVKGGSEEFLFPGCIPERVQGTVADVVDFNHTPREIHPSMKEHIFNCFKDESWKQNKSKTGVITIFDGCREGHFRHGYTLHRIYSIEGISPTLTRINDHHFLEIGGKLTSKERWALMGAPLEAYEIAKQYLTEREINAAIGNGVVVPLFKELLEAVIFFISH